VLGRYVRDESLLSLPEAIRRMTSLPADTIGLEGRGRLEPGAWADIVVLDADAIRDEATLEKPRRNATGIDAVVVNGTIVYRNRRLTGELAGSVLRHR
jgi:N-acyl-D-amino-acid deacylase